MIAHVLVAALAASTPALFSSYDVLEIQLTAPFNELFDRGRRDDRFAVDGTLTYTVEGRQVTLDRVRLELRGHTSLNRGECTFPKLKVSVRDQQRDSTLFAGVRSLKIGTHCGEAPDGQVSEKYGRLANEKSPWREAFVYRLLDALGVATLKARPARVTYVFTDPKPGASPNQQQPLVRNAMLLEDTDAAVARLGGGGEIDEHDFSNARAMFSPADTERVAFAEALIGNFDWCLKMTPDDRYRCDARHPLWNLTAAAMENGRAKPIVHDFDVSGIVSGHHPWFDDVFNAAFSPSHSEAEVEVTAQLQRARTLFARDDLDAVRSGFARRKADAYAALDKAAIDSAGRQIAKRYLDSFFRAIESDDDFYRPVVAAAGASMHAEPGGPPLCEASGPVPIGTPVTTPLQTHDDMIQVRLLDALWHWAPPVKCSAARRDAVWIKADAVSADYPKR